MTITLEEMKNYLRVDFEDDDRLIEGLIRSGQKMCMDILRTDDPAVLENPDAGQPSFMRLRISTNTARRLTIMR